MSQLHLKILTPEKEIYDSQVDSLVVPSAQGEMGIYPHHVNLMAKIVPGELRIRIGNKTQVMATGAGFLQIANNVVTVLADLAENAEDIDEKAVEEAKRRAEQALEQKLSDEEYAETLAVLEKSLARLRVKRRHRTR